MTHGIATGEKEARKLPRFQTAAERDHLRDMFSQYSDHELLIVIDELRELIRSRGSSHARVPKRSQAVSA